MAAPGMLRPARRLAAMLLPSPPVMRSWRAWGVAAAAAVTTILVIAALLEFLAPDLSYQLGDRGREVVSGAARQNYRIALGATSGSSYRVGTALNKYFVFKGRVRARARCHSRAGNVQALLDRNQAFDLATINSADDDASKTDTIRALAALETQYFFVIVPNTSPAREFRDLTGAVNPGVREAGHPPTLGERVLEYYGLVPPPSQTGEQNARVSVVRPTQAGVLADFASGHTSAATRTQLLHAGLVEGILDGGGYRLLPIRDHEALARSIPGARAGFIPAGLYGPQRRIPAEPVPTIAVTQLLVARADIPGRVVHDILEVVYDPRFARELQLELTETSGRDVGGLPLHRAADIYYHRNDVLTSDRLGRLSFVASAIAALVATGQFISRYRKNDLMARRRRLLAEELAKLESIRQQIENAPDAESARQLMRQADDVLCGAEHDAAADPLDSAGIQSLRSLHGVCRQTETSAIQAP